MPILADNTVIPSYLGLQSRGQVGDDGSLTNVALRLGEVKEIIYPNSKRSVSGRVIEYTVEVQHRDGFGPGTSTIYETCVVGNLFGGIADVFRYTLREDHKANESATGLGVGSKVLLMCVNGQSNHAIILGGVRDFQNDKKTSDKYEDGHNLYFEFNGLSFAINKDGEATVQFKGPTKWDGTLDTDKGASDDHGPTTVQFQKNGNLVISTKDQNQSIIIDHENKKVAFAFDSEWSVNVNGKSSISIGDDLTVTAGTTIALGAKGNVALSSSTGTMALSCVGGMSISSAGLSIGKATDAMLKGTTFRQHQSEMHQSMTNQLAQLSAHLAAAGTSLSASQFSAAGSQLAQAAAAVTQLAAAIAQFEGQSGDVLSQVNKAD